MTSTTRFPVILPSETQSREFDAKLVLAGLLAERGHPVYVGSRIEIHNNIHRLPRGLYLAKDIRGSSRRIFRILGNLGFDIAAWDEEAFIFIDEATYHRKRVDTDNLNQVKAFFALGEKNRALVKRAPGYRGTPVHVTGNPRIDMLGARCRGFYDTEVKALRQKYGEFILINSNFGSINHFLPDQVVARAADGSLTNLVDGKADFWEFRIDMFAEFKALLPVVAKAFPDRQIVLRPHPAEAHDTWRAAAGGAANVKVVHEGSVYPWIMASAVAIHNGCTTGLESYLMDHPVIVYQPVQSDAFDDLLANHVSTPALSQDELIATIEAVMGGKRIARPAPGIRAEVEAYFGSLDGKLASERMDAIIADEGGSWSGRAPAATTRMSGYLEAAGRSAVKAINAHRRGHKNSRAHNQHRYPGMSEADVAERLQRLSGVLGRFPNLQVEQVRGNIFRVSRS